MVSQSFINITTDIPSAAVSTNSVHEDYVRVIPLTIDATLLNYNTIITDRTGIINFGMNTNSYTTRCSNSITFHQRRNS